MRVAVVGGGAAGIIAAKRLRDAGAAAGTAVEVVGFERADELGGLWVFRDGPDGKLYHGLRTNTDKRAMELPDFPMPAQWPPFLSHWQCVEYLRAFAAHFGVAPLFRTGVDVVAWEQRGGGGWAVRTRRRGAAESAVEEEHFDCVCVCCGQTSVPFVPEVPGLKEFEGEVLHSSQYRHVGPFVGRNVLVVGLGTASGSDIAQELSFGAKQVYLSIRRGASGMPRFVDGKPWDTTGGRTHEIAYHHLPDAFRRRVTDRLQRHALAAQVHGAGRQEDAGIPRLRPGDVPGGGARGDGAPAPAHELPVTFYTDCNNLPQRVAVGAVRVNAAGLRAFRRGSAVFNDGEERDVDCVVFATGFTRRGGATRLWNYIFDPARPGIAHILQVHPIGPHWPLADQQARFAAAAFVGRARLPPPAEMEAAAFDVGAHQSLTSVNSAGEIGRLSREMGVAPPGRAELLWRLLRPATRARTVAYLRSFNTRPWRHPDDVAPWPAPQGALFTSKL